MLGFVQLGIFQIWLTLTEWQRCQTLLLTRAPFLRIDYNLCNVYENIVRLGRRPRVSFREILAMLLLRHSFSGTNLIGRKGLR